MRDVREACSGLAITVEGSKFQGREANPGCCLSFWRIHRGAKPAKSLLIEVPEKAGRTVAQGAATLIAENLLDVTGDGAIPSVQDAVNPFVTMIAVIRKPIWRNITSHSCAFSLSFRCKRIAPRSRQRRGAQS